MKNENITKTSELNKASQVQKKHKLTSTLSTISMFLVAIVVAILLTTFVFQQYQVDGPSMQTTLYNGDRLIVVKYQRTWARITGHPYIPNIGDIIVFNENGIYNAQGVQEKQLVKRVVALPGDRVVISNGVLKVYDSAHPNGFSPDQTLPYGKVITYTSGNINIVLPKNYIFVCGDNRPDSYDSRDFGPINVNQIVGKLDLRIYPFDQLTGF